MSRRPTGLKPEVFIKQALALAPESYEPTNLWVVLVSYPSGPSASDATISIKLTILQIKFISPQFKK